MCCLEKFQQVQFDPVDGSRERPLADTLTLPYLSLLIFCAKHDTVTCHRETRLYILWQVSLFQH